MMLPLPRLAKLNPRHRMRKAQSLLAACERSLANGVKIDISYLEALLLFLENDASLPPAVRKGAAFFHPLKEGDAFRAASTLRMDILRELGQDPGEWDFIIPGSGRLDPGVRACAAGTRAYLEDIRSPFNIGSIFRTAEGFALESLLLSPSCADPAHPRAERSAMGATSSLPWRRAELTELAEAENVFALELGGTPIDQFEFPERGTVILGSEELGLSPEALALAKAGRVSIPMSGAKASLNVGVAFGILMACWRKAQKST
jgi:TrmH family RNA methyltransferase